MNLFFNRLSRVTKLSSAEPAHDVAQVSVPKTVKDSTNLTNQPFTSNSENRLTSAMLAKLGANAGTNSSEKRHAADPIKTITKSVTSVNHYALDIRDCIDLLLTGHLTRENDLADHYPVDRQGSHPHHLSQLYSNREVKRDEQLKNTRENFNNTSLQVTDLHVVDALTMDRLLADYLVAQRLRSPMTEE